MQVIESWPEFSARQACEFIVTGRQASFRTGEMTNRIVFANGAVSDGNNHADPPTDPRTLLVLRREYVKAKLDREVKDFHAYQSAVLQQAAAHRRFGSLAVPEPPAEAPALLRAGQARIAALREELAGIDKRLEDPTAAARREERRKREAEQASRQSALVSEILSVRI